MRRAPILLAITALACRGKETPKPAPAPPAAPPAAAPVTASTPNVAHDKPALPAVTAAAPTSGKIADQFAADPVDATWSGKTEGELHATFAKMKHPPGEAECHSRLCRVTIAGNETDVAASVEELQALQGKAQSLLLTAPVKDADGKLKLVAYLQYERAD
jgi:hypothetical protein